MRIKHVQRGAVGALSVIVILTGAGTAAANGWLPIFESERVAPVTFGASDLVALPDLGAYGDLVVDGEPHVRSVATAELATEATGLDAPQPTALPRGVSGEPDYVVAGAVSATFTLSDDAPAALIGTQIQFAAGPGLAAIWSGPGDVPRLVVARAVAPTASSSGASLDDIRDHLLSLPGFPDDLADQLRTLSTDGSTLPLPVSTERFTTATDDVNGLPATVLATRDRTLAAVVWIDDGVVTVVAGSLNTDELLSVARGLR